MVRHWLVQNLGATKRKILCGLQARKRHIPLAQGFGPVRVIIERHSMAQEVGQGLWVKLQPRLPEGAFMVNRGK